MKTALSALTMSLPEPIAGKAPTEFRVLRAGLNTTEKGDFLFDGAAAKSVMDAYTAKGLDKIQIDYEHQSMQAPPGGGDARKPAAGWFKPEVRGGELWATAIAWTRTALGMLAPSEGAPEYRYFSPVLFFDEETRQVTGLKNIALTNDPAVDSLTPLVAATATGKDTPMAECASCATLSAQLKAAQEQCTSLTARLSTFEKDEPDKKAAMTSLTAVRSQLCTLTGKATEAEALGVVVGLKTAHEELSTFKAKVDKETNERATAELTAALDGFVKAGKMTPGGAEKANQRGYWEGKAKAVGVERTMVELTACAPLLGEIVKPGGVGNPTQKPGGTAILTAADREVAAEMGTDVVAFEKWKTEQDEKRALSLAGR